MRSQIRTLYYGCHWADHRYQLEIGLPPVGLVNPDVQSDKQQAMFHNPYTLVIDPDSAVLEVPWMSHRRPVFFRRACPVHQRRSAKIGGVGEPLHSPLGHRGGTGAALVPIAEVAT